MSKLLASEVAVRATEKAVQVCGGWGYIRDLPVEKWYRDAKLYTIFEGTSEIQRLVIGRTLAEEAPKGPLHFDLPGDADGLRQTLGRGSPTRSKIGQALLKPVNVRRQGEKTIFVTALGADCFRKQRDPVQISSSGMQTREVVADAALMAQLRLDPSRQLLGAQCSGTLVLAKLGLLGGVAACTDLTTKPWVEEAGVAGTRHRRRA